MNYRHAFHAGNFADVVKHAVLTRIVLYLQGKEKAFRVIDTHAGPGRYDLQAQTAERTGEWRDGIGRLAAASLPADAAALLEPYLRAQATENTAASSRFYAGSPLLVRRLFRPQDRLTAIELHPEDARRLKALFEGDVQVRVIELDGWLALGAHLPPKEKRGLVLIDPPFEAPGEFDRMVSGLRQAVRRWPGGTYVLWYPVKDRGAVARFRSELQGLGLPKLLDIRFAVRGPSPDPRLDACGLAVVNPPFTLTGELERLLPVLRDCLAQDRGASYELVDLSGSREELDR